MQIVGGQRQVDVDVLESKQNGAKVSWATLAANGRSFVSLCGREILRVTVTESDGACELLTKHRCDGHVWVMAEPTSRPSWRMTLFFMECTAASIAG